MGRPERAEGVRPAHLGEAVPNFYGASLTEAEQVDLAEAAEVENLGDEIAVLRVRLKTALKDRPEDYALLVRGIGLLVTAVAAQYRLSPRASKDLSDNLAAVLNRFGDIIMPER